MRLATFSGPDWPFWRRMLPEKKLAASAVREVTAGGKLGLKVLVWSTRSGVV
jgi:hypothetical protein